MIYTIGRVFSLVLDAAEARLAHMGSSSEPPESPGTIFRPQRPACAVRQCPCRPRGPEPVTLVQVPVLLSRVWAQGVVRHFVRLRG